MAFGYGNFRTGAIDGSLPVAAKIPGAVAGGNVCCFTEVFDLSKSNVLKTAGTANVVAGKPSGHILLGIEIVSSVSLTTSQLAFGTAATPAKYGAAAAYGTTPNVRKTWDVATAENAISDSAEQIIMTSSTADLPAAGIVVVRMYTAARG